MPENLVPNRAEVKITELDFDNIKSNLQTYLKSQEEFKDYNFDGSSMSILLDLLAYNTHYQSYYANMVANEMFLDSAQTRNSVVSLAKHLAYTPQSVTSPVATVDVRWTGENNNPGAYLNKGEVFTATASGQTYSFVTLSNHTIESTGTNEWRASSVNLYEGRLSTISFVVDLNNPDQKFIIPDSSVDTRTLTIRVQKSRANISGFSEVWEPVKNIIDLTSLSKAYYIQEDTNGKYEVYFGDGVVSENLIDGNIITIEYLTSHGPDANTIGATDSASAPTFNYGLGIVSVIGQAGGGAERESTDSIKYHAPLAYQAQERAVTTNDYEYIILRDYPDIESVFVWGGEDNDPPQYGKVYISLKPRSGRYISDVEKLTIANDLLKRRNVVGILPEIVDPIFVYLSFTGNVNYDSRKTNISATDLASKIYDKIVNYVDQDLEKFNRELYFSDFSAQIDKIDDAILSNELDIKMEYRLAPILGSNQSYEFSYGNGIYHPHDGHIPVLSTSSFTHFDGSIMGKSFIEDDGKGALKLYTFKAGEKYIYNNNIGSVDYATGKVVIKGFAPTQIENTTHIKFYAPPAEPDITLKRNIILTMDQYDTNAVVLTMVDKSRPGTVGETRYLGGKTY